VHHLADLHCCRGSRRRPRVHERRRGGRMEALRPALAGTPSRARGGSSPCYVG